MVIEIIVKLIIYSIKHVKTFTDTVIVQITNDLSMDKIIFEIYSNLDAVLDIIP